MWGSHHMKPFSKLLSASPGELLKLKFPLLHVCLRLDCTFLNISTISFGCTVWRYLGQCFPKHSTPTQYRKLLQRAEDKSYVLTALYLTKDIHYSTQGSIAQGWDYTALHPLTRMLQWDFWSFQSALISNPTHIIPTRFPSWPYTKSKLHAPIPCYHDTDCWTESVIHDSDNIYRNEKLTGITLTLSIAPVFAYSLGLFIIQNKIYYKTR